MGSVKQIMHEEREAAHNAAVRFAREQIEQGLLPPKVTLGSLSDFEWRKLSEAIISGWILERSRQLSAERIFDEQAFLAEGSDPEPAALGHIKSLLPAIGDLVEKTGLGERAINEWPQHEILLLFFNVADMAVRAATCRDERPTDPDVNSTLLMAG